MPLGDNFEPLGVDFRSLGVDIGFGNQFGPQDVAVRH